jgi:thiamine biosynthesis lipoprotein
MTATLRALTIVLATVVASQAWAAGLSVHAVRYVMGTWCDLVIFDPDPAPDVVQSAFREIARLEDVLSSWNPESEVSLLNASAGQGPRPVSVDLANVADESAALCRSTGGAFDPSVGRLLRAWGFYTESPRLPPPAIGREAESHVGCDRVTVRRDSRTIALAEGAALDFGSIGKGYAVDHALAILRARGVTRAKIDFGSSSLGYLGNIDGGWPVVIPDPRDRDNPLFYVRITGGAAVSTSSQRERFFERDGRRFGHIFDPRLGRPVESSLMSVTVIAPRGSTADALSTALFVMGAAQGKRLINAMPGVGAVFVEQSAKGLVTTTAGKVPRLTRFSN